ncbi:hypothetical protein [Lactococcus lactis]|uniref:hypothetical protein n=1 Tax=Lactococcus lactis TaxID=1358 RepID=UPI001F5BB01D|nr:hypothetical protein [Lactococcus lactis]WDA67451.1 hypothetical protein IL310_01410 [Lactococcus lactis]WDA67478.1 hypothetical protein IL310_01545 [Lactococcus lactis]
MRDYNNFSGNKYSLRAKTYHMIKRIDFISNHLGSLGDLLVTTWLGLILTILVLAMGVALIGHAIFANSMATAIANIPAMILILIGTILISLNTVVTNPAMGLQVIVSLKFLNKRVRNRGEKNSLIDFKPFKFVDGISDLDIIETVNEKSKTYLVAYRVRGSVSPITFTDDLQTLAGLKHQLLSNMERDTVLATINSVGKTAIKKKKLPKNATKSMKRKQEVNHAVISNLRYNQTLETVVFLASPNLDVLRTRQESLEVSFKNGLVIGYYQLKGEEFKSTVNSIYG